MVFSRRWVDILLTMLDIYSFIKFEWSLLTGGLCSEVKTIQKYPTYYHSTESIFVLEMYIHYFDLTENECETNSKT